MTDFVLEQERNYAHVTRDIKKNPFLLVVDYAKFLKQPLTLSMFVSCDVDGNVLKELFEDFDGSNHLWITKYNEAKEKVLFEGFAWDGEYVSGNNLDFIYVDNSFCEDRTIEGFINAWLHEHSVMNIELTESAIKQIGL